MALVQLWRPLLLEQDIPQQKVGLKSYPDHCCWISSVVLRVNVGTHSELVYSQSLRALGFVLTLCFPVGGSSRCILAKLLQGLSRAQPESETVLHPSFSFSFLFQRRITLYEMTSCLNFRD